LTSYLRSCRLAALAGVATIALIAVSAAPAGAARTKCRTLTTAPYRECVQKFRLSVKVALFDQIHPHPRVEVTIKVSDPHVKVTLYKLKPGKNKVFASSYRFFRRIFSGHMKAGKHVLVFHLSQPAAHYELKVKARVHPTSKAPAASKTVERFFALP
jgi:hypothetical protein